MATSEPVLEVDRSESFTNGLLHNLWDMKAHGKLTDLTIIAANVPIPCHSVVMAAASEHVRVLLDGPMKEDTRKEIELNFDEIYVQRVVEYCYTGKIRIELSAAKPYLRIAEYFHLTELKAKIDKFVCEHVSAKTCVEWYSLAKEFGLGDVEKKCNEIMAAKFKEVTEHFEFHQLPVKELIHCIKLVGNADVALEACVSWMSLDILSRSKDFLDLLNHIKLDQCSPQCAERVLQKWQPIWPNYTEVQQALRPRASAVPRAPAKPSKLKMMILGGQTQARELNSTWWKIDLKAGTCEVFKTMDDRVLKHKPGYCFTPGQLFVIGGSRELKTYQPLPDCHALSVQDSQYDVWPDVDDPLAETVVISVSDHIYTFGGDSTDKAVYRLNLKTKTWKRCADMPVGNLFPIIAHIMHKVYMIFNTTKYNEKFKTSNVVTMYCFDTCTLTWTSLTPLPVSIKNACSSKAVSVGEDIYLVGGMGKLCAKYSPKHKTWTMLETPQMVHRAFAAVQMDGEIILCGGHDDSFKVHDLIEVYNIAQNSWKVHSVRMPVGLQFHHCAVYDEVARKLLQ